MQKLVRELLDDSGAGVRRDASGRRYFKQRRVRFQTIHFDAASLLKSGWLEFEQELESPFLHMRDPAPASVQEFARNSSERFLSFYYRVFDVAVARALATLDTNLFRTPFLVGSVYLDLGIPENTEIGSVPRALNAVILEQYRKSRRRHADQRSKTHERAIPPEKVQNENPALSGEVDAGTEEAKSNTATRRVIPEAAQSATVKANQPGPVEDGEASRHDRPSLEQTDSGPRISFLSEYLEGLTDDAIELLRPYQRIWSIEDRIKKIQEMSKSIQGQWERTLLGRPRSHYLQEIQKELLDALNERGMSNLLRRTERAELRKNLRRFMLEKEPGALNYVCVNIESFASEIPEHLLSRIRMAYLPEKMERTFRSALLQETRLHARLMRYIHLKYRGAPPGATTDLRLIHHQRNEAMTEAREMLRKVTVLHAGASSLVDILEEHASLRKELRKIHEDFIAGAPGQRKNIPEQTTEAILEPGDRPFRTAQTKYGKAVDWPSHIAYGNPFARREVLLHIKQQLLDRLRPVRSTTTGYSLIPGSRHGILPLNPVMKLWKDRPGFEKALPSIASLEINTPDTVECLVRLARLVHPELSDLELRLGRIVREKRGSLGLKNMQIFLMPGSCGAAREIERPDFPEFRNSVIGESRKPEELGVSAEPSILTGAWYKKKNHALYYPIGGDNGQLLRSIYLALRLPGPAAFFFALGQFVHDCLPDTLVYYAGSEIPFRQITEDYFRLEDRVRKNRGEKTGRRKIDNSRPAVRFMFAVAYSRALMEALTGSSQSNFRHPPTEKWMSRYLNLPVLSVTDRNRFRSIRGRARSIIETASRAMERG